MTQAASSWLRFLLAMALLAAAAVFLQARDAAEVLPARRPLASFPAQMEGWVGTDVSIHPDILNVLGAGEFLSRIYRRDSEEPYVDFFLAYFPSQRTGDTIHSPKNCLPGAGWAPVSAGRLQLTLPGGAKVTVNRYVIAKGLDRQMVLYWYQAHGRVVASEYWAKIYLVLDAVRRNRSDGALVRVVTPIRRGEDIRSAENRVAEFANHILPTLDDHIPQ